MQLQYIYILHMYIDSFKTVEKSVGSNSTFVSIIVEIRLDLGHTNEVIQELLLKYCWSGISFSLGYENQWDLNYDLNDHLSSSRLPTRLWLYCGPLWKQLMALRGSRTFLACSMLTTPRTSTRMSRQPIFLLPREADEAKVFILNR